MLQALHHVIAGFLRRTWLVAAVTVAICAGFAAHAVAALSDAALAPGEGAPAPGAAPKAAPPAPAPAPRRAPPNGDVFVARNIFCSSCPPVRPGGGGGGGDAYQGQPAVLIATSLGADPRATVRVVPTEVQGSWGLGEEIPGVGRVDEIHATAIEVADAAGHTKLISLLDGTAAGPGAIDAATSNAPPAAANDPFAGRVTKLDDTTYEVERALIRELVMGASRPGMGRAVPKVVNGEVQGINLYGIGAESPGRALGLRSGDLISSIDGVPLKNAQQLIDLFARLDQVAAVELGGARAGKPFKLALKLR